MDTKERLDVLPWIAVAALVAAVVGLALAGVALLKAGEDTGTSPMGGMAGMGGMNAAGHEAMGHMAPLSIEGITDSPADRGGTPLAGQRRGGALEFELEARPVWWNITPERRISAWAYNGIVPGPAIRVRNGERVRIRFTNRLPEPTSIHWHGIDVPNSQDGVPGVTQKPIEPGESFLYEFTARPAGEPRGSGTFIYHSHLEEDRQMPAGLSGTFIIDPPAGRPKTPERTIAVSEWTVDPAGGRTRGVMPMDGMWPNFFTINGKAFPATERIDVEAGEETVFRLVNLGQFAHPLHLHGTAFRVIARDGHRLAQPELRDTLTLESGERADIAFELPRGRWLFHCHIGHHVTNDGDGPGGLMAVVQAR